MSPFCKAIVEKIDSSKYTVNWDDHKLTPGMIADIISKEDNAVWCSVYALNNGVVTVQSGPFVWDSEPDFKDYTEVACRVQDGLEALEEYTITVSAMESDGWTLNF